MERKYQYLHKNENLLALAKINRIYHILTKKFSTTIIIDPVKILMKIYMQD